MHSPLVSVIIVNYNGKNYLKQCLNAVLNAEYPNMEVIVVDNGSSDDSVDMVKDTFCRDFRIKVIQNEKNFGPAYARNAGIKIAKGKYIAFLDNDTEPEPTWLNEPIKVMEYDRTIGACQCKLLLMDDHRRLDYVGDYLSQYGFLVQRVDGGELDNGQADTPDEILSAKSAAMVIRHDVLDEIGDFDEDYFIYLEETDLGWRVWLKGFRIIFVPESRVYHAFGTTQKILPKQQNYLVKFHGTKNYITTLIKNLDTKNLLKILPLHIALWIGMAGWFGIKRQTNDSWFIIKGIFWNVVNLKMVWKKRRIVQKMRVVSDEDIMHKIMKKKSLNYFYNKLATPHKIGNTEGFYRPKEEIK